MLGLANRARKLALGMSAAIGSLKKKRCKLIILAHDIAANAERKITAEALDAGVDIVRSGNKDALGRAFGRKEVAIIAVEDAGFAQSLKEILS